MARPVSRHLIETFFAAMSYDIEMRQVPMRARADPVRYVRDRPSFSKGSVFTDDLVAVSALRVEHPPLTDTYALKFEGSGKTAVFSADTRYHPPLAAFAKGADVLVHEVMHREGTERMCARLKEIKPNLMEHMIAGHTFGDDVGRIANAAGVGHLVVQHFTPSDDPETGPEDFAAWCGRHGRGRSRSEKI